MKIGRPIPKQRVTSVPVETLMEEVRTEMKQMMTPPIADADVFVSNMSDLPWLYFIVIHAVCILLLLRL